jgi:putative transposase
MPSQSQRPSLFTTVVGSTIAGTAMSPANLRYEVCDQTVGNVLQRHALPPAPERKRTTTWPAFIWAQLALLASTDFFTAEVLTLRGLVTY